MSNSNHAISDQRYLERAFRTLIMLHSVRRYTYNEIAEALKTSKRTVQRYIHDWKSIGLEIEMEQGCPRLQQGKRNNDILKIMKETAEWRNVSKVVELETAISTDKCVVLVGYASGHSYTVKDREVEPFKMTDNKQYEWCYDPQDGQCKVYCPSRCQQVKVLNRSRTHHTQYKSENIDIFGFHGTNPIKVKLLLDVVARNLLLETNPESALQITKIEGDNKWLLNTGVYDIRGIGRFCMGLIDCFEIIEAPELQEYIEEQCKKVVGIKRKTRQ